MQTDSPEMPAAKLAATKKTHPSKATPIGRDISDAKLRALKPAEKAYRQAVGGGLYLEVMPTGSKLWRWKYRLDGRENRFAIGKYPRISLVQAREAVEQARKLVQEGRHPSLQKKIDGLEAAHGRLHTLEDLTKEWLGLKTWEDITKTRRLKVGLAPNRRTLFWFKKRLIVNHNSRVIHRACLWTTGRALDWHKSPVVHRSYAHGG